MWRRGGSGGGQSNVARTEYREFAIADLDDDGFGDLVVAREFIDANGLERGAVDVFRRNPASSQSLLPEVSYPVARIRKGIAVADMNGADQLDVIVSCT